MPEIDTLINDIEKLRENLYRTMDEKDGNMLDPELLSASKVLNAAIDQYNKIVQKKMEKSKIKNSRNII